DWLTTAPMEVEGHEVSVNRYFLNHPEMVLGTYSGKGTLYGKEGYSVVSNGDLAEQLKLAVAPLPEHVHDKNVVDIQQPFEKPPVTTQQFVPSLPERHISEGSFFVHDNRIHQLVDGQAVPVVYGGGELWANGGLVGRRMGALIELRDKARR